MYQPNANDVKYTIEKSINSLKENSVNAGIAFFGGSFTAIKREYMLSLLEATKPYINSFKGIRVSTRPDYIDEEVLLLLKDYKVTAIELGAQSMCDEVLSYNDRGHSAQSVIRASQLIKKHGFSLGLQMMTGLYKSTIDKDMETAKAFVDIKPDTVRIYPTVIMKNTKLETLYNDGVYIPYSFDDTVSLCADLLRLFESNSISVIRLGLHHSDTLQKDMIAGAYHPAFRELCESKIMLDKVIQLLNNKDKNLVYELMVAPSCVSKLIGNNKSNIKRLNDLGYNIKIIQETSVGEMDVVLK